MKEEAIANWFYRALQKTEADTSLDETERNQTLFRLFRKMLLERTQGEQLYFSTLFARMAYAFQRYGLEQPLPQYLHRWRRWIQTPERRSPDMPAFLQAADAALAQSIRAFYQIDFPETGTASWGKPLPRPKQEGTTVAFRKHLRVVVLELRSETQELIGYPDTRQEERIRIRYNLSDRNELFTRNIREIGRTFNFPVSVQLIDTEIDQDGIYRPAAFVLEPDFLVDVTAIAECFKDKRTEPALYLLNKYLPMRVNKYLLTGHLANYFLDELLTSPDIPFRELMPRVFRLNPIGFSQLDDHEIREIQSWAVGHYQTLREMAVQGFRDQQIDPENCSLEPTFFSMEYGLQGRLDILHRQADESTIVELKSGKPYRANAYGISDNHYVQTLLYDLLVRAAYGERTDPKKYILYSGQPLNPLRYAPRSTHQQYEALEVRNTLISLERRLANTYANDPEQPLLRSPAAQLFARLSKAHLSHFSGFAERDLLRFETTYRNLADAEKKYLIAYSGFIAREHRLAKTGDEQREGVNGQAGLWLNGPEEKENAFSILRYLKLSDNQAGAEEPVLRFRRTEGKTNALANFRVGDIGVLYPAGHHPLRHQLFKCSILAVNASEVSVRLRSRVFSDNIFEQYTHWNLEPDLIDSSFGSMYRSLFSFAAAPEERRQLLLGQRVPARPTEWPVYQRPGLTPEQNRLLGKLLAAPDYFLLWGPPGTGKTSVMLREAVASLLEETDERILLLAYTNRAVDEMCASVESISTELREIYCRIGSRYSTSPDYREQLLDHKIRDVRTRRDLVDLLKTQRIYIATLSSWYGKQDLHKLLSFDRVIIDEASQILEPMLLGLLPGFSRFVLIGDHQQLPAVVAQSAPESAVADDELQALGLVNMRNSLFERLYHLARENDWHWAYDQLRHQGRMHQKIMAFPNQHFYRGNLDILPEEIPVHQRQTAPLPWAAFPEIDRLPKGLFRQRLLFVPTGADPDGSGRKTSRPEAELVVRLIAAFQTIFGEMKKPDTYDLGVITPYRAQIALIRDLLQQAEVDPDMYTIDTVERYQGGARDVIILSLCTNDQDQLHSLVSLSDEGVDRKLNVALTRAREQIIILGDPDILRHNSTYNLLMQAGAVVSDI